MFPAEFDYHKAGSVAEAVQLLQANPAAMLLAGGHSLLPLMKLRLARPPALVDIGGIADLRGIGVSGNAIRIGALATHSQIADSRDIQQANPLLAEAAEGIGDPAVRNRGTIGGNIAHADPASDWPTVLAALEATIDVQGPGGSRSIAAGDFFQEAFETALSPGEVITAVQAPVLSGQGGVGEYAKMAHPASFYAVVGGCAVVTVENDRCTAARVAVGGLVPSPVRATSVERALVGQPLTADRITEAVGQLSADLGDNIIGDVYASADYRRAVAPVEVKHALFHAVGLSHH